MSSSEDNKRKRASRQMNPESPFSRIVRVKGLDFIKSNFDRILATAEEEENNIDISTLLHVSTPNLQADSEAAANIASFSCKVLSKKTKEVYPTFKVRLDSEDDLKKLRTLSEAQVTTFLGSQSSVPLDLHRLAALKQSVWETTLMDPSNFAIHRCHNKRCFNPEHMYFGSSDLNRSTDFCQVWVIVNGVPVNVCPHEPKCLRPGARAIPKQ